MRLDQEYAAYSYREDRQVPGFDETGPVAVMDGECVLCTAGARLIDRFDRSGEVRICPSQSALGQALLVHYGLAPDDPESWLFLQDGQAYSSMDAWIRAGAAVGGPGWLLQPFRLLPRFLQDWLYLRVARNRFQLFGRTDMCAVAGPSLRARLIGTR